MTSSRNTPADRASVVAPDSPVVVIGAGQVPQALGEQAAGEARGAVGDLVERPASDEDVAQDDDRPALGEELRCPSDRAILPVVAHIRSLSLADGLG